MPKLRNPGDLFAAAHVMGQIRRARQERGMTSRQAAEKIGMDPSYWRTLETGRHPNPSYSTIFAMADAVGLIVGVVSDDLPNLDAAQVRALARLAVRYEAGSPGPLPDALATAIDAMRRFAS